MKGFGRKNDILIGISTSGNSKNIIDAIITAKKIGMKTIAMTGSDGGQLKNICDFLINVPSKNTARIQESHIMIGHIICEIVEKKYFIIFKWYYILICHFILPIKNSLLSIIKNSCISLPSVSINTMFCSLNSIFSI